MCEKITEECNQKFLDKVREINEDLSKNMSLITSPEPIKDLENCSAYRWYTWSKEMEEELEEYVNSNIDVVSKLNGLIFLSSFKTTNQHDHYMFVRIASPCLQPNTVTTTILSIVSTMSSHSIVGPGLITNMRRKTTELRIKYET
jgi:hypothetical protein